MKIKIANLASDDVKLEFLCAILAGIFLGLGVISWMFDVKTYVLFFVIFAFLMWISKMMEFAESQEDRRVQKLTYEQRLPWMCRRQAD